MECACYCAIILASSIEYQYPEQSHQLRQIAAQLKDITPDEFKTWLQSGWLDLVNLENSLHAKLGKGRSTREENLANQPETEPLILTPEELIVETIETDIELEP